MFRFAFQLSPKLCVIKPKLGSACLIPDADGRQIWFWGEGGKSAHSFVAVRFHTFYASLAFSQRIHRSNYPISMEWRTDSYSGKNQMLSIYSLATTPHFQHSANSSWVVASPRGDILTQKGPKVMLIKCCRWHISLGSSCGTQGLSFMSSKRLHLGNPNWVGVPKGETHLGYQNDLKKPFKRQFKKISLS